LTASHIVDKFGNGVRGTPYSFSTDESVELIMAKTMTKLKRRHFFFLNPYKDAAFTRCPKCQSKTKVRKFPLVIHIEPRQLFLLNKACRYCPGCNLIIVKKSEIESLMVEAFERSKPELVGNDYFVVGVVDRKDWREGQQGKLLECEAIERMFVFRDVLTFEPAYPAWYPDIKTPPSKK